MLAVLLLVLVDGDAQLGLVQRVGDAEDGREVAVVQRAHEGGAVDSVPRRRADVVQAAVAKLKADGSMSDLMSDLRRRVRSRICLAGSQCRRPVQAQRVRWYFSPSLSELSSQMIVLLSNS